MSGFPWARFEEKARRMSIPELKFAIRDCIEARDAIASHDEQRSLDYQDEASVYRKELSSRYRRNLARTMRENAALEDRTVLE